MKKQSPDYVLIGVIATLILIGFLALTSASSFYSVNSAEKASFFLKRQFLIGLLPGLLAGYFFFLIRLEWIKKLAPFLFFGSLAAAAAVLIQGIGSESGGATRWLSISSLTFQPAEFLKVGFIVYTALWLSQKKRKKGLAPWLAFSIIVLSIVVVLLMQPNYSMIVLLSAIGLIMFWSSEQPNKYFWSIAGTIGSALIIFLLTSGYRMQRVMTMLDRDKDPLGAGYQINQTLIAIGSGGWFGVGLGLSRQRAGYIPQTINDTIFAIYGEETGFVGVCVLIALLLTFLVLGFRISQRARDSFSELVAVGITSWICLQAFINISAMTGLVPLTGVPFPLMSYGASHYVAELIGLGILLNISKNQV